MPTFQPPYASVLCAVNGGTPTAGPQVVTSTSAALQFSAVSTANWQTGLWELYDQPPGYSPPSGWTLDPGGSIYYWATGVNPNPPPVTLQQWGKLPCRLTVDGGIDPTGLLNAGRMIDTSSVITMASPVTGLWDMFVGEGSQIGLFRKWVGDYKRNLRAIETYIANAGYAASFQRVSYSASPQDIVIAQPHAKQFVLVAGSGGASQLNVPNTTRGVVDCQELVFCDADGAFGTNPPKLTVSGGTKIANPLSAGTFSASSVYPISMAGNPVAFVYGAEEDTWFLC